MNLYSWDLKLEIWDSEPNRLGTWDLGLFKLTSISTSFQGSIKFDYSMSVF